MIGIILRLIYKIPGLVRQVCFHWNSLAESTCTHSSTDSDLNSDLSLLRCAKACLSSDVIVARCLLSRSLLVASLTSLYCGVSVLLLIWYNSLLLLSLSSLSIRPTTKQYHVYACGLSALRRL